MRRTSATVLLALVCFAALFDAAAALDNARRLRERSLQARSKRVQAQSRATTGVHAHLQSMARAGLMGGASKAHAFLDHVMAGKANLGAGFEAYEHSYGSGFDAKGTADAIKFQHINAVTGAIEEVTTADRVLVSDDLVDFSYSEMTGVAGDYWAPKDLNANIICSLGTASAKTAKRDKGAPQEARFYAAFNDMWANPEYGRGGSTLKKPLASGAGFAPVTEQEKRDGWMGYMENQLRRMIQSEKDGVAANWPKPSDQHGGSKYYEGSAKGALANIASIVGDVAKAGTRAKEALSAISEGNGRALSINDDHFWQCAQETYALGHTLAVKAAFAAGKAYAAATPVAPAPKPGAKPAPAPSAGVVLAAKQAAAKALTKAYAMDGFVSHFLSDQFSSGHLRTPRVQLRTACSMVTDGAKEAGLTANVMHDEDNWNCVLVKNARGNVWWACGDHRFFDHENGMNRRMLHDAIAASVGAVSAAFVAGTKAAPNAADPTTVQGWRAEGLQYVGSTDGLTLRQSVENTCPLYRLNTQTNKIDHRSGSLAQWPRPAIAKKYHFGSSLRWNMASTAFPAYVDMTAVATTAGKELAETNDAFLARLKLKNTDPSLYCSEYRAFVDRSLVGSDDCCAVAGRATPQYVTAGTAFDDALPNPVTKWPSTADMANKDKRVTYLNKCFVTQQVELAGKAVKNTAVKVGNEIVNGLAAIGEAQMQMGGMGMPF